MSSIISNHNPDILLSLTADWQVWLQNNIAKNVSEDQLIQSMAKGNIAEDTARRCIHAIKHAEAINKQIGLKPMAPLLGDWQKWVDEQLNAGHLERSMIQAATLSIRLANSNRLKKLREASEKQGFTYEPNIFPVKGAVHHAGRTMPVVMDIDKPRIVLFANVLSKEECEQLIAFSQPKMQQSVLRNEASTEMEVSKVRTSEGAYLKLGETALIQTIEERISALINWPVDKGEGMQVLHYQTGAEYRPHFDFFTPELAGSKINMKRGGQRVSTLIMYLNDVEDGGETIFPKQNIKIKAVQGNALYFSYTNSKNELDRNTLHGGAPVLKGEKWIMTKWLRQDKI